MSFSKYNIYLFLFLPICYMVYFHVVSSSQIGLHRLIGNWPNRPLCRVIGNAPLPHSRFHTTMVYDAPKCEHRRQKYSHRHRITLLARIIPYVGRRGSADVGRQRSIGDDRRFFWNVQNNRPTLADSSIPTMAAYDVVRCRPMSGGGRAMAPRRRPT